MLGMGISEAFFTEDDIANLSGKENPGALFQKSTLLPDHLLIFHWIQSHGANTRKHQDIKKQAPALPAKK